MLNLKLVLTTLSDKLESEHGFRGETKHSDARAKPRTTQPVSLFIEWVDRNPEVRELLEKSGVAWPIVPKG